tara:strand:- start:1385 stop:2014 length:630 start_codon:yes stop_codon:yes gene_type:complete
LANASNKRWIKKHLSDTYVKKARKMGFRSRAAFKLIEIDQKCNLIKPGMSILDLGAAPGSWSQIISKKLKKEIKKIVAVDLLPIDPIDGVEFLQGDFLDEKTIDKIRKIFEKDKIDLILSDISPNLSGIGVADASRVNHLGELVLDFCKGNLNVNGSILLKTFHCSGYSQLVEEYKKVFCQVSKKKPESSRPESAEVFILAKNLKSKVF